VLPVSEARLENAVPITLILLPIGPMELIVILGIVVILFGATRIPQLGKGLGEGIRNFRKGLKGDDEEARQIEEKVSSKTS
jgi:sec-independent protein translocase protein TatA